MTIKVSNVYNTKSLNKSIENLREQVKKDIDEIKKQVNAIDKDTTIVGQASIYDVDWEYIDRGKDIRFNFTIWKDGQKITANQIYAICNKTCLRPCYF